jgi:hypothetical protein
MMSPGRILKTGARRQHYWNHLSKGQSREKTADVGAPAGLDLILPSPDRSPALLAIGAGGRFLKAFWI